MILRRTSAPIRGAFLLFLEDDLGQGLSGEIGAGHVVGHLHVVALAYEAGDVGQRDVVALGGVVEFSVEESRLIIRMSSPEG